MFSFAASVKGDVCLIERGGVLGSAMPNSEELEQLDLNMLAMYCLRVAESRTSTPSDVEQARQLKTEWALFIGHARPPIPGLETLEDIEAYGKQLKQRMVSFLARCSLSGGLATSKATSSNGNARGTAAGHGN